MKVGTDGILLGAWVSTEGAGKLLDIGTGSGLIALMAAQRCAAGGDRRFHITGIDIDAEAAEQAAENFAASPWAEQLSARHAGLAEFVEEGHDGAFDVIVSNPPYYITGKSIIPAGEARTAARRDSELTLDDVVEAAVRLLSPTGRLSLILPTAREADLTAAMTRAGMAFSRRCLVRTTERKEPSRLLAEIYPWGRSHKKVETYPANQPPAYSEWCRSGSFHWTYPKNGCHLPQNREESYANCVETYLTIGSEEFRKLTGDYYL